MDDNTAREVWRWIPGYEARYEVSDVGRVRSWLPYKGTPVPRVLRQHPNRWGYINVGLARDLGMRTLTVHSLVAAAFLGTRPDGMQVRHLNGDRSDNRSTNLAYGTAAENSDDRRRHGTHGNSVKDRCPQDHEYDEANTYHHNGQRHCRACRLERNRAWLARRRAS